MKEPTQRDRQAEERRNQLIDTALSLFAQRGFGNTSMKDLAEAAGVAQGLVYHYFRSKEDLLLAAIERRSFRSEMGRMFVAEPDRPAPEVLRTVSRNFADLMADRDTLLRVVAHEALTDPRVAVFLRNAIQEAVDLLARYLDLRIAAGELRRHDATVTARTLFYMVVMLHLTNASTEEALTTLVDTLLIGISADR